jgi:exonuclease III
MAFRKKAEFILAQKPDILVIPECECPDKLKFNSDIPVPTDILWYGTNKNKGLGVFSYSSLRFKLLEDHQPDFKTILPIAVTGGKVDFTLLAIWANNPEDIDPYIGQIWKSINHYDNLLSGKNIILIGDFNSNTIWDKKHRGGDHTTVVEFLKRKDIHSTYHEFFGAVQGKEENSTLFMYRHENKPHHIDYCFASSYFMKKLKDVSVGNYRDWKEYSDHTPLIITFDL